MTTTRVPAILKALHTQADAALTDIQVSLGFGVTDDPGDFLMVGAEDPDSLEDAHAADSSQTWAGLGNHARDETGDISCVALSWNGDGDPVAALDAVTATLAAVENLLRADPTLGGVLTSGWAHISGPFAWTQAQGETGAACQVVFHISFKARI